MPEQKPQPKTFSTNVEKDIHVTVEAVNDATLNEKLVSDIIEAFQNELEDWRVDQDDLDGNYTLSVCEIVEKTTDQDENIAVPIEHEGVDGGHLIVYGWKEI